MGSGASKEREDQARFDSLLTVHPKHLNIPIIFCSGCGEVDFNEEHLSCSFQLTNITDRIVAYAIWPSWKEHSLSKLIIPIDEGTYVGTILPRSTSRVTVNLGKKPPPKEKEHIGFHASVVKAGVKAEEITSWNDLARLSDMKKSGHFELPVVFYHTVPAANSSSAAVSEEKKKEKEKLLHPSNNKEMKRVVNSPPPAELVIPTTGGGYGSTSQRKSEGTRVKPSFRLFSAMEIQDATNNFSESLLIRKGGYGMVYKCQLDNWDVAVKILDVQGYQGLNEYIKEVEIRTRIVYEICTILRFLHAKKPPLVHGDVKPRNILLDTNFKVKLADFGFGRYLTEGENSKAFCHTVNGSGSHGYIDPDFLGSLKVTVGVDVYSFGKTVVKILTGKHPPDIFSKVYEAKKRGSLMTIVDPAVRCWPEDVIESLARFALKAIKPDRGKPEFMGNFYNELEKILDGIDNCTTAAI